MNLNADERAVVCLDSLVKLEYFYKFGLLKSLPKPSDIFKDTRLITRYFKSVGKEIYADTVIKAIKNEEFVDSCVSLATANADGVVTYYSDGYPLEFKNIPEPPLAVYYRGNLNLLKSLIFYSFLSK